MRFGSKVQHGTRLVCRQQLGHQRSIAKVTVHKHMARITVERSQVLPVACVGEFVEVDDGFV